MKIMCFHLEHTFGTSSPADCPKLRISLMASLLLLRICVISGGVTTDSSLSSDCIVLGGIATTVLRLRSNGILPGMPEIVPFDIFLDPFVVVLGGVPELEDEANITHSRSASAEELNHPVKC
jgi:hypothetical protein